MVALSKRFVYGNIWVSICALSLCWLSYFEFGVNPDAEMLLFVFFSTLIIYNMNMISGLKALVEQGTDSARHHWCIANASFLKLGTVIGMIGATICFVLLKIHAWTVLFPFGVAAVLYVIPLIGKRGSGVRLREFGLNKIFTIAVVWAVVTLILPIVNANGYMALSEADLWWRSLGRAAFIFAITLPFDIRDLKNDQKINVRTLPMILGVKKTLFVSVFILAVYGLVYAVAENDKLIGLGHLMGALITSVLVMRTNADRTDMFYSFSLEGMMVVLTACVYLLSLFA